MHKEFSDPIHKFVKAYDCELRLIDSPVLQRLRFVKQLGVAYLVFPSAQHTRFEHSLGTMELAGRMCQSLGIKDGKLCSLYRLAGLLHDVGHLPFSHTTEVLLGDKSHEEIGERLIKEGLVGSLLLKCGYAYEDIELLCRMAFRKDFNPLPKVITGEFGADRMDYLIRDAYFCGTSYGFFDYERLLNNLLLVDGKKCLHISSLRALESFIIGRYFMYSQVYFHRVVRILNIHLNELIMDLIKQGALELDNLHLRTDAHILSLLLERQEDPKVRRLLLREHYREVFSTSSKELYEYAKERLTERYEPELLRFDRAYKKVLEEDILLFDGSKLLSVKEVSPMVSSLKDIEVYRIYAHPSYKEEVKGFVDGALKRA